MSGREERLDPEFRARLRQVLVLHVAEERPARRETRRAWGLVAAVSLVAGLGTAWVLADRPAESVAGGLDVQPVEVVCASGVGPTGALSESGGALTEPRGITITVSVAGGGPASPELIDGCARLWDEGLLAPEQFQSSAPQSTRVSVPALALCSLVDGAPVVVPVSDCRTAGMVDWSDAERPGS